MASSRLNGYTTTHGAGGLYLDCLPIDKSHDCGVPHFYFVTDGPTSHVGFRNRLALLRWLELRGIEAPEEIEEPGPDGAPVKSMRLVGTYRRVRLLNSEDFGRIEGVQTWEMDNGQYTRAVVTTESDGVRTVCFLDPNASGLEVLDWREGRAIEDAGRL